MGVVEALFKVEVEEIGDEDVVKIVAAVAVGGSKTGLPSSRTVGSGNRRGETVVASPDPQPRLGQGMVMEWSP